MQEFYLRHFKKKKFSENYKNNSDSDSDFVSGIEMRCSNLV